MAAVALPPTPRSISFPHNILHDPLPDRRSPPKMEQASSKPSLPSISSLIQAVKDQPPNGSPPMAHQRKHSGASSGHGPTSPDRSGLMGSPRSLPPPTPPLPGPSSFDFGPRHSPRNTSPASATTSHHNYYPHLSANSQPESYAAPRSSYPPLPEPGQWAPSSQDMSPRESSRGDEARSSTSSYPEIPPAEGRYPGMSEQRPLPANFPPAPGQASSLPPIDPAMSAAQSPAQPWQHHHYYPPANSLAYPPPADRYVCPTCQKPFSRPSSLKIHTYSHTGEKPFKCKHEGCGKYFSVRSNMKRHEKGCHGGDASSAASNSPKP